MERDTAVQAVFEPVRPLTSFEGTVERLGTAIRLGLLAPGSRLPSERELATELGISRSTLRGALTTLVQSGHLISVRGRAGGTFVAENPPLTDASNPLAERTEAAIDFRVAIETGAVILACERCDDSDRERLSRLVDRMAEPEDFEDYRRTDTRFHIGLAEAAHSPRLVTAMTEVQSDMTDLIALIAHPIEVLTRSNDQHRRLVAQLRRGDRSRAVRTIREHIEGTEHILAGLLPRPGAT
jgi:GntR family transcriptional repressor for pyruvate dehydrogenase complex